MRKASHKSPGFLYSKVSPGLKTSAAWGKLFSLRSRNLGQMRSQSPFVTFYPALFQVKSKRQEEQLRTDVLSSPREKAAKPEVIFKRPKGALHLDRPTLAQIDSILCRNVLIRSPKVH